MSNKRVVTLIVIASIIVLVTVCIAAAGPALINMMRSIHTIPAH